MKDQKPQNIYDNEVFYDGYTKGRLDEGSPNKNEEEPAILSLLPSIKGKSILDLGCGKGEYCQKFIKMGAMKVTGVDISNKMLETARQQVKNVEFIRSDIGDLSFIKEKFDIVFSSMAVHYIEDFNNMCKQIFHTLNDNGHFVFSTENPLQLAPLKGSSWTKDENDKKLHFNLSHYALEGKREMTWFVDGVIKYHRMTSTIVNTLIYNGFTIEKILEPTASAAAVKKFPKLADAVHKPHFLLVKAKKPKS